MRDTSLFVVLTALVIMGCATHSATSGRIVIRDDHVVAEPRFSDRDCALIEEYYRTAKPKQNPPGLTKREQLPPGLARRDTLPPGLQGRPLPHELESRLTVLPAASVRVTIGRDVVLMQRDTRLVLDIVHGVASQ